MVNSSGLPVCVAGSCSVVGILMGLSGALVGWLVARSGAVSLWNGLGNTSKPLKNKGFRNSCTQRIRDAYTGHMAQNIITTNKTINGHNVEVIEDHNLIRTDDSYSKSNAGTGCYLCGKKIGKSPWHIHMSVNHDLLPFDTDCDFGNESQGCFPIGSECRKNLPKNYTKKLDD